MCTHVNQVQITKSKGPPPLTLALYFYHLSQVHVNLNTYPSLAYNFVVTASCLSHYLLNTYILMYVHICVFMSKNKLLEII